ncbi:MAG: LapA family protein [Minwuia sp.]|uniref:LapA family protein n=1 Tax=Minwuia sp. TaxID=2493630 RepID=UPI003A888405
MKLIKLIVFLAAIIVGVSIGISNKEPVTLALEPIPYAVEFPLYLVIFACFLAGMIFGGIVVWFRDGRVRKRARSAESRAGELARELDANEKALDEALHRDPVRSGQPALRGPEAV